MDDYSKTGPKTPSSGAKERERNKLPIMQELLEVENENDFIDELRSKLDITPSHPGYLPAIKLWRELHPSR